MRRREFIGAVSLASLTPRLVRAQGIRRVGVLMNIAAKDPETSIRIRELSVGLRLAGWAVGHNLILDIRSGEGSISNYQVQAAELAKAEPDILLATNGPTLEALRQITGTRPILFVNVTDPEGLGLVRSLAHPSGNATGYAQFETGISAKWCDLALRLNPGMQDLIVLHDRSLNASQAQLLRIQTEIAKHVTVSALDISQLDRIGELGLRARPGMIVTTSAKALIARQQIASAATAHDIIAVYYNRAYPEAGGLISYGPDQVRPFRDIATYIDKILRGASPADLPVQLPTRYQLVVNATTAFRQKIALPQDVVALADEVIE